MSLSDARRKSLKRKRTALNKEIKLLETQLNKIELLLDDWDDRSNYFGNDGIDYSIERLKAA